jgi:hypothetical protein
MYREEAGLTFFCMRRRMGTTENEIGEGESVCLGAEGQNYIFTAQCKHV